MAKRNLGFLMPQLMGNTNNPGAGVGVLLHRRMHLVSNPTQTLPQTLPCSLNIPPCSLHSLQNRRSRRRKPNLFDSDWESDWELLPKKRGTKKKGKKDSDSGPLPLPPFDSWWWPADTVPPPPYPPNTVLFNTEYGYDRALNKIKDERLPSVLFFTAYCCKKTSKWIHPFFPELCEQFKHITIYVFPLPPQDVFFSMHLLGLKSVNRSLYFV